MEISVLTGIWIDRQKEHGSSYVTLRKSGCRFYVNREIRIKYGHFSDSVLGLAFNRKGYVTDRNPDTVSPFSRDPDILRKFQL